MKRKPIKLDTIIQNALTGEDAYLKSFDATMEICGEEVSYLGYTYVDENGEQAPVEPELEDYNWDSAVLAYCKEYGIPEPEDQVKIIQSLSQKVSLDKFGFEFKFENGELSKKTISYSDWQKLLEVIENYPLTKALYEALVK